jgi:hypothetical protein
VISPVIARSSRTGVPVRSEVSAVASVMPADGPSFGTAPAGTWTWMSLSAKTFGSMPRAVARARTYDIAACTDSFITSPS